MKHAKKSFSFFQNFQENFLPFIIILLDSEDSNESQDYDEESNPSGKKSNKEKKKLTSFCGWIKQIWSEIEGNYHTFFIYKYC